MCWSTPRLVEVLDPAERAAIQAYWRPKIALADFRVEADILDIPAFLPPRSCASSKSARNRGFRASFRSLVRTPDEIVHVNVDEISTAEEGVRDANKR